MIQIGIFNGYFPYTLKEQAEKIRALGFNTVQLDLAFKDADKIRIAHAKDVKRSAGKCPELTDLNSDQQQNGLQADLKIDRLTMGRFGLLPSGSALGALFAASREIWFLAATASETVFEGGQRTAAVAAAPRGLREQRGQLSADRSYR
jgi:sugar phosphate isomerase/epimerase